MKTDIHLISAPWSDILTPSIQLGTLKAHLDRCDFKEINVTGHSAFLEIPFDAFESVLSRWDEIQFYEEYLYSLALIDRFYKNELKKLFVSFKDLVSRVVKAFKNHKYVLTPGVIRALSRTSDKYVKKNLISKSKKEKILVYGFTLNYHQVTSSLYLAKSIYEQSKNKNIIFLFGGMSISVPNVVKLINKLGLPSFGVLGEGEGKLEKIAKLCQNGSSYSEVLKNLPTIKGVFSVSNAPNLWVKDKSMYEGEYSDLSALPIPYYDEYYTLVDSICDEKTKLFFYSRIKLPIEGTRGCFAKCSFCGLNYVWNGFRKMSPDVIIDRLEKHAIKYRPFKHKFVDNVCDTWAESYADESIARNIATPTFLELRAHHAESFWTKLALAGVDEIQIGLEALSEGVLKLIGKGTTVTQNILAQKYLMELNIDSMSNLITHYPGSTPSEVAETKTLIEKIPHFQPFALSEFLFVMGSPLFEKLSEQERQQLEPKRKVKYPKALEAFQIDFGFKIPDGLLAPESKKAWDDFVLWYRKYQHCETTKNSKLTCQIMPDARLRIFDCRNGKSEVYYFEDDDVLIYEKCHAGPRAELIVKQTGYQLSNVMKALKKFDSLGLVHQVSGHWIALATRKRDVLVTALFRSQLKKLSEQSQSSSCAIQPNPQVDMS